MIVASPRLSRFVLDFWPCTMKIVGAHSFVVPAATCDPGPLLVPVMDVGEWEAAEIRWLSPVRQVDRGLQRGSFGTWAVRAVLVLAVMPLTHLVALTAFWKFSRPLLSSIATGLAIAIPAGSNLFDTLTVLVTQVSAVEKNLCMEILGQRLDLKTFADDAMRGILEIDEATMCLDPGDREEVKNEQTKFPAEFHERTEFKESCRVKRVVTAKAKAKAAAAEAGPKGRGRGKGAAAPPRPRVLKLPPDVIEQRAAKVFAHPGSFVWRANQGQSWQGRYPPYRCVSRSWHLYGGNRPALILVLKSLWRQYLEYNALPDSACTVQGLMTDPELVVVTF